MSNILLYSENKKSNKKTVILNEMKLSTIQSISLLSLSRCSNRPNLNILMERVRVREGEREKERKKERERETETDRQIEREGHTH